VERGGARVGDCYCGIVECGVAVEWRFLLSLNEVVSLRFGERAGCW